MTKKVAPKSVSGRVVNTGYSVPSLAGERDLCALERPIQLRCIRTTLGPVDRLQVVEQAVGVVGDAEEPLLQLARLDRRAAAFAATVDDLLVGEHRGVLGAPVDRCLLAVGQAALEEAQEQPLRPAVVARMAGGELARPVDRDAPPRNWRWNWAIDFSLESRGCSPVLIAWFSAGRPNAS